MEERPDVERATRWPSFLTHVRAILFDMLATRAQGTTGLPVRYSDRFR